MLARIGLIIVSLLFVGTLTGATQVAQRRLLQIHYIDVEGGAATLIVTPAGESILIDAGWP
ncbi:MAG: MBL fold metallo-hydrolase, partial [Acidobacteriota bacterium]